MEKRAVLLYDEAVKKLRQANEELGRPEEDVVSYLVCRNSQFAIENFLKGYLLSKGKDSQGTRKISTLYEQCLALNPKFGELDLSGFTCKSYAPDSRSCSDSEKVSKCYEIASKINDFISQEATLN